MNDEETKKLLAWRPVSVFHVVPQDVVEARLSLLSPEDAELLKDAFSSRMPGRVYEYAPRGRETEYLYFGGNLRGSPSENVADTMLRCSETGGDYERSMRLFKASAACDDDRTAEGGDTKAACVREAKYRYMMEKAVRLNGAFANGAPPRKKRQDPDGPPHIVRSRDDFRAK